MLSKRGLPQAGDLEVIPLAAAAAAAFPRRDLTEAQARALGYGARLDATGAGDGAGGGVRPGRLAGRAADRRRWPGALAGRLRHRAGRGPGRRVLTCPRRPLPWQAVGMQRWAGPLDVPDDWGRSVVTIGEFDGVHRGHQRIVAQGCRVGR